MLTIKRNLLVKDLKYFNWMSNLREEFIDLAPEFKDKEVISLCPILEFFLKKKNYYRLAD